MAHENRSVDGSPVPTGVCVTLDHSTQTFTVQIRALRFVSPETIKDLIQKKFEVIDVKETDSVSFVHPR